ncbi:MAG TPA: hypothetical protein VGL36_35600 [Kribbella sp.]
MSNPHDGQVDPATQPSPAAQPAHPAQPATPARQVGSVPAPRCAVGRPLCQQPALPALQLCADCRAAGYCPWCGRHGTTAGYCSTDCLRADTEPRRLEAEWVADVVKAYFHAPDAQLLLGTVPDPAADTDPAGNAVGPFWALTWADGPAQWASTFTAAVNDLSPELAAEEWPGGLYVDDLTPNTLAIFFD